MITVTGLGAVRGHKAILHDISLELYPGVIGLVAPNGSGKTTLLESLATPWDKRVVGEVLLDENVPTPRVWERSVFFLPSAGKVLEPSMTGRQHAELARSLWGSSAKVEKIAASCGSSGILDIPVRKCSQGMKQLVAITVAMCTGAKLLLLDEPLSALDPTNVARVTSALRRYARGGRTVLMSTHNLANVDAACDQVIFIKDGAIAATNEGSGRRPCLEIYRELYEPLGPFSFATAHATNSARAAEE